MQNNLPMPGVPSWEVWVRWRRHPKPRTSGLHNKRHAHQAVFIIKRGMNTQCTATVAVVTPIRVLYKKKTQTKQNARLKDEGVGAPAQNTTRNMSGAAIAYNDIS